MHQLPLSIAPDHPAFAGHFPGQPIIPGVVLLDMALRALWAQGLTTTRTGSLSMAKFMRPAGPGAELSLAAELRNGIWQLHLRDGEFTIATAQWTPADPEASR